VNVNKAHTDRGLEILAFLVEEIPHHPRDLVQVTCKKFGVTRQAVSRYLRELVDDGRIVASGKTNRRQYSLPVLRREAFVLPISNLEEDVVWREKIAPLVVQLPSNVVHIWQYCASEMVNNVIDHSGGTELTLVIQQNAASTEITVTDNGVGIFRKIKQFCNLEDERHAVLELAKGKLTTDPARHTGEGIFFTSRMLDDFAILSGDVYFSHKHEHEEDWILQREKPNTGTAVFMLLANASTRTTQEVFDYFASEDHDYGFTKTVVPVRLAQHGAEQLISRSQAKRLLARIDRFAIVLFDFKGVEVIGPAFADEIFRVFERSHPNTRLLPINTPPTVDQMIQRARSVPAA
jgi:anti-sigma regulatory factor (Ser/Thr protein kinase)